MAVNRIKYFAALSVMAIVFQPAVSQTVPGMALNADFAAQVKSIDEFICRFNGTETNPEIKKDSSWLENNLIALFDFQMSHEGLSETDFKQLITGFVRQVMEDRTKLHITDSSMWAEIQSDIKAGGKKKSVTLVLRSEVYGDNHVRWAIVGAKGLVESGIIDTSKYYSISPVEHEIHFMSLDNIFRQNRSDIMGYRGKDTPIDELSVFLALAMTGYIEFETVTQLTIHCLEVPGYVFTVNEQGRRGYNSGWLISKLAPLKENDKQQYIKKLLNK